MTPSNNQPTRRRSPFRGVALALIILMVVPATRGPILAGISHLPGIALTVVMFILGALVMLLAVCGNAPRRR